jgi:hypothetical protein
MACGCGKVVQGAVGLAKVAAGKAGVKVLLAEVFEVRQRRDACRECEHATRNQDRLDLPTKGLTTFSQCKLCGCLIAAKTLLADEQCPASPPKWDRSRIAKIRAQQVPPK